MSKYIPGNQKHLTLENRIYIENELNKSTSFKESLINLCCLLAKITASGMDYKILCTICSLIYLNKMIAAS